MCPIEYQTKTDRELLIVTVEKINDMDEKLDSFCGIVADQGEELNKLQISVNSVKEHSKNNRNLIIALWVIVIGSVSAGVTMILKHLGLA